MFLVYSIVKAFSITSYSISNQFTFRSGDFSSSTLSLNALAGLTALTRGRNEGRGEREERRERKGKGLKGRKGGRGERKRG